MPSLEAGSIIGATMGSHFFLPVPFLTIHVHTEEYHR